MSHLIPIDEVAHFDVCTHVASTGAVSDADSAPTFSVYEEDTDTAILGPTSMTKRTSLTGNYRGSFTASAANGFEAGKWYSVIVSATVSTVAAKTVGMHFRVAPAESSAGVPKGDVSHFGGTAGTFSSGRPEVNTTHAAGTAWGSGAITAASIAADAITAAKVADGTIDAATFAAGAINAAAIASDAITAAKIADGAIDAATFASGALDAVWSTAARTLTALDEDSTTLDLDATIRGAVGLASANLDTQLDALPTAAENATAVWGAGTRSLTILDEDSTTLDLDATIRAAVGLASANLDTQLGDIGAVTDKVDDTLELTSDGYIFTVAALQQAPSGTGASATDIADEVQTRTIAAVTVVNGLANNTITAAALASDAGTEIATAVWASGTRTLTAIDEDSTTLDLDATIRAAVGMASADLDTQLDAIAVDAAAADVRGERTVCRGTVTTGASTTSIPTSALTPAGAAADQFKGRIIIFDIDTTTAALRGQATDITASSNSSTPTFTVTALTSTPASGDTFTIV